MKNAGLAGASVESIERVYCEQLARFRRVARALLGDRDVARDVVQEAFAAAVRQRGSFRGEGDLEGWLWRLVVNAALSERRRRSRRPTEQLSDFVAPVLNGDGELAARVGAAVSLLPERQRLVVFLHYYADLDYGRIAEALEISQGTVAASLHAARQTLRHTLGRRRFSNE
jgi:RNA polymerase sigma-70 factor, ECF subfamily